MGPLRADSTPAFCHVAAQVCGAGWSLEFSNDTSFSLRIRNATGRSSGTYKCTLGEQNGERNLSSTVTLKVTGCPGIEEDKLKKYKGELFMLTCLGIFYLLLIFFTCVSNFLSHKQSNNTNQNTPTHFLC
uniref:Uncharacterized protein n=1 Tax=Geospiza parvula TaxID=87175 RepID=A0A8C3MAJ8_GEOPR